MEPNQNNLLRETYELARENNKMLHAMRRNAFLGGVFKLIFWIALIVAPIWFYSTYLSPILDSALKTMGQVQGTGSNLQAQLNGLGDTLKKFESQLPASFQPKK